MTGRDEETSWRWRWRCPGCGRIVQGEGDAAAKLEAERAIHAHLAAEAWALGKAS